MSEQSRRSTLERSERIMPITGDATVPVMLSFTLFREPHGCEGITTSGFKQSVGNPKLEKTSRTLSNFFVRRLPDGVLSRSHDEQAPDVKCAQSHPS